MQNILERIVDLCSKPYQSEVHTLKQLREVKTLASRNVDVLTQILDDYVKQNDGHKDRPNRVKGAKKMLNI